jgi:hypothetical protein
MLSARVWRDFLSRLLSALRAPRSRKRNSVYFRPLLRQLEERTVPAVYNINTTGQAGQTVATLSAAIALADANPDASNIINLGAGTYTSSNLSIVAAPNKELTIIGQASGVTITGGQQNRVFTIDANVTFANLTITGGKVVEAGGKGTSAMGGGLLIGSGHVALSNVNVSGNMVHGGTGSPGATGTPSIAAKKGGAGGAAAGGGIYLAGGSLTLLNSSVTNNQAVGGAGGAGAPGTTAVNGGTGGVGGDGQGGGIFVANGNLTLTNSPITSNQALAGNGGAGGLSGGAVGNNRGRGGEGGVGAGGGVFIQNGSAVFRSASFKQNDAAGGGGGSGRGSSAIGNTGGVGRGGGLFVSGSAKVNGFSGSFKSNSAHGGGGGTGAPSYASGHGGAGQGGGVYLASGALNLVTVSLDKNHAQGGAGHGIGSINGAQYVPGGGSGAGGAFYQQGGSAKDFGGSVTGNSAVGGVGSNGRSTNAKPGSPGGNASGGGIYLGSGSLLIDASSLSGDNALAGNGGNGGVGSAGVGSGGYGGYAAGGGVFVAAPTQSLDLNLVNSTVSNDQAQGGVGGRGSRGGNGGAGLGGGVFALSKSPDLVGSEQVNLAGTTVSGSAIGGAGGRSVGALGMNLGSTGGDALGGGLGQAEDSGSYYYVFTASAAPDVYSADATLTGTVTGGAGGSGGPSGQAQGAGSFGNAFPLDVQATKLVLSPTLPAIFADAASPDPVYVVAEDAAGNVDPAFAGPVTLTLLNGPGNSHGNAQLVGALSEPATNGVAQFTGIDVATDGVASSANQYEVQAASIGGLASAPSNLFSVNGYSPAMIRSAYGVNSLPPDAQGQALDGSGQTIAVIVAYDDPNLFLDVNNFDRQFGVASTGPSLYSQYGPASSFLTVLNQYGQSTPLPGADPAGPSSSGANWAGNEALDVEWAHAIAPGAHIDVIECASPSSLASAAAIAAALPNVTVVSMSFGTPETTSDSSDNSDFTTPTGHAGVTFLAATGNTGGTGADYPAFSPNVVAVGGTTLSLNSQGIVASERGWKQSGGGVSLNEAEPAYQSGVQTTGLRTIPDVAAVADPSTGAAAFDSFNQSPGDTLEVAGTTDLATPVWAGLFALVNQGRAAEGESSLNSSANPTQSLAALYSLPASDFNSKLGGANGTSTTGLTNPAVYNEVTGLGSPVATGLIPDLVAYGSALSLSTGSLPGATVGANYAHTITSVGGSGSVMLSDQITSGSLPSGLMFTLNQTSLVVMGKPIAAGTVNFTVTATDASQHTYTQAYMLTVNPAIVLPSELFSAVAGASFDQTIVATGGTGLKTVALSSGSVGPGLTVTMLNNELEISGTPSTPGVYNFSVTATDAAGASTPANYALTVSSVGAPSISSVSPGFGPTVGGTQVTITGTNLTNAVAVDFGVNPAAIVSDSDTKLVVTNPGSGAGTVNVTVTTAAGTSATTSADAFDYLRAPVVAGLSPARGPLIGGETVTITGSNLAIASKVYFGAALATFKVDSNNVIEATVPAGSAGVVDVTVQSASGVSQINTADEFTYVPVPVVAGVSPSSGDAFGGDQVTITGTNLAGASEVDFGNIPVTSFVSDSATQIVLNSPSAGGVAGTIDVAVVTDGGTSLPTLADEFTYGAGAPPTVGYISPGAGAVVGGATVNVFGTNFTPDSTVMFGNTPATNVTVVSSTQITAVAPAQGTMPALVDITVTTGQGTSSTTTNDQYVYQGPPSVTGVSPNAGPMKGGVVVVITGTNLLGTLAVDFNQTPALSFYDQSASQIEAYAPAGTGIEDITVTTTSGTSPISPVDQFMFQGPPTVTGVSPSSGSTAGGDQVTITGTNLESATAVDFGGAAVTSFISDSPTQIVLDSPAGTDGVVDVTVVAAGGTSTANAADEFTYGVGALPTVTALSTAIGPPTGGTATTITGSNFTPGCTVMFGATAATSVTVLSSTQISATSPAEGAMASTVDVTVTNAVGTSSTSTLDQFTYQDVPTVTNVSPAAGPLAAGTQVTITGTNLAGATAVSFGSAPAVSFFNASPTQIVAVAPAGTNGAVDVTVTTTSGTSAQSSADQYTYQSAPSVSGLSPASGPLSGGAQITITGSNLENATEVDFGSTPVTSFLSDSATQIVLNAPAGAGTVDVTVVTPGGTSAKTAADRFTFAAVPSVAGVSPSTGSTAGGSYIVVSGSNLANASAVSFGSAGNGVIISDSATQLVVQSPAGVAGTVDLTVTTPGGVSSITTADQFTYIAPPTVTQVSPPNDSTSGGSAITITGTNLSNAIAVEFGATVVSSFTSDSATQIVLNDPPEPAGNVDVVVVTSAGSSPTSLADVFTYGAGVAPTVFGVSPSAGLSTGGASVTISGQDFTSDSTVKFGTTAATAVTVVSSSQIVATAPAQGAMASTVDVTVTTAAGTSTTSAADQFSYGSPATSVVSLSASHVRSGSTVVVTLQAKDASGANLANGGLTVAFGTGSGAGGGTFSSVTDNGNGTYSAVFTGTTIGTTTITATIDGQPVTTTAPSIQVISSAPSLSLSTVTLASGSVQSGNTDVVTLQARDSLGYDFTSGGLTVTFNLGGGKATGSFSSVKDNGDGTYSATFTGTLDGSNTITATIGGQPLTSTAPTITVTPGPVDLGMSTVTLASGTVQSSLTDVVTLSARDYAGNLVGGGLTVAFQLGGGAATGTFTPVKDNGDGTYTATFTGTLAGANTITATINTQSLTSTAPTITVAPGPVSLSQSTVSLASGSIQSGGTDLVTLKARDGAGNTLTTGGLSVVFTVGNGAATGTFSSVQDNGDGTYTATFTGTLAGSNTISATIGAKPLTSTAPTITITPGPLSLAKSVVTLASSSVQSGSTDLVTVMAEDANGNLLSSGGLAVVLIQGNGSGQGMLTGVTDNHNGTYTATFTGITAGTNTIGATISGKPLTSTAPTITTTPGPASALKSIVKLASSSVQSGSTDTITLQAVDANGNKLTSGGDVVVFSLGSTSGGQGTITGETDNKDGTYTATFTGMLAGGNTITATIDAHSVVSTAPIAVTPGPIDTHNTTVTLGATSIQSGFATTVTVKPVDAAGNFLVSPSLNFSLGRGNATGSFGAPANNGDGTYTSTFTGILAGQNQIIVTVNNVHLAPQMIAVTPGPLDPANSLLTLAPPNIQFGGTTKITVQARDAAGNDELASSGTVVVALGSTTTGAKGTLSKVTDNKNGSYSATFTGTFDGANTIGATIGGATVGSGPQTVNVSLDAYSSSRSTLKLSSAAITSGPPYSVMVTFQAVDARGVKEIGGGLAVTFKLASTRGGQGVFGPVMDNGNGTYTAQFTGTIAGSNSIKALVGGRAVTASAPFKVSPGPINLAKSTVTVSAASVKAGSAVTVTLHAKDAAGNALTTGGAAVVFGLGSGVGQGTFTTPKDNKNGTYTSTFTGTLAGANTITAVVNSAPVTSTAPAISVLVGAASVAKSTLSATGTTVQAENTITVTLKTYDGENNPLTVGGLKVAFGLASTHGGLGTFGKVTDLKNGTYTATFTGTLAGSNAITATIGGAKLTTAGPTITVTPGKLSLAKSTVTVASPIVAATGTDTVTLQAKDAYGNDVAVNNLIVAFALTSTSGGQGTFGAVSYNGNGAYEALFFPAKAGSNAIKATINQSPVASAPAAIKVL